MIVISIFEIPACVACVLCLFRYYCLFRYRPHSEGNRDRTLKELAVLNTTFGQMSRHIIWGDEQPRNLYKSPIKCNLLEALLDAYYHG